MTQTPPITDSTTAKALSTTDTQKKDLAGGNSNQAPAAESFDQDLAIDTLPNRLTAVRILMVPLVVWCLSEDSAIRNIPGMIFFTIAAITDYLDGYYARSQKIITIMGQLIDPLADKILVVSSLVMLQALGRIHPVVVIILVCREFAITGLRAVASAEGIVIAASRMAKWKTVTQMVGIPMLMFGNHIPGVPFLLPGNILIYLSLLISVWSLKDYIVGFFKGLAERRRLKRAQRQSMKGKRRKRKEREKNS